MSITDIDLRITFNDEATKPNKLVSGKFPFHKVNGLVNPLDVSFYVSNRGIDSIQRGGRRSQIPSLKLGNKFEINTSKGAFSLLLQVDIPNKFFSHIKLDSTRKSVAAHMAKRNIDRMSRGSSSRIPALFALLRSTMNKVCSVDLLFTPTFTSAEPHSMTAPYPYLLYNRPLTEYQTT
jgi:hypothetical protein